MTIILYCFAFFGIGCLVGLVVAALLGAAAHGDRQEDIKDSYWAGYDAGKRQAKDA